MLFYSAFCSVALWIYHPKAYGVLRSGTHVTTPCEVHCATIYLAFLLVNNWSFRCALGSQKNISSSVDYLLVCRLQGIRFNSFKVRYKSKTTRHYDFGSVKLYQERKRLTSGRRASLKNSFGESP